MPTTAVGCGESFYHRLESVKQRVVERGVDADQFALVTGVSSDEAGDILLGVGIEDFSEGEEILLADAQGKFAHGVPEQAGKVAFEIADRIDAEAVDVEAGDHVLIGANQEALQIGIVRLQLFQNAEIADRVVAIASRSALPPEELVLLKLRRPHDRVERWIGNGCDVGKVGPSGAGLIAPLNRLGEA